jgi:hypothetical protein
MSSVVLLEGFLAARTLELATLAIRTVVLVAGAVVARAITSPLELHQNPPKMIHLIPLRNHKWLIPASPLAVYVLANTHTR